MAGNTRGRLKERFEGIHKNFGWIQEHCEQSLELIREHNPKLSKAMKALHKGCTTLDKLAQDIYGKI
ncbi:unnamed protein product [marine sediment metagenome]|uniref:Uncharacterized protein n=1 Tax=marine sediment metagenome TaxID=412755 RepID=X1C9I6_9ZZZZ